MKTYATLIDGALHVLERIPHISNASAQQLEQYAAARGYKQVVYCAQPGRFYTPGWHETEKHITQTWTPWEPEEARAAALETVQEQLDARLSARDTVPCMGIPAGIIYDTAALTNALGMEPGDIFIDAADNLYTLTPELTENIRFALRNYRLGLYGGATDCRRRIAAADSVDALEEVVREF